MKILVTFIFIVFVCCTAYSQQDFIKWNKNLPINWSDFKGKVDITSPYSAMSAIGIHYKYNCWSDGIVYKMTFEVSSRFDKTKSWSKKYLESGYTLKHEQLHFDIAELVSRIFRREVENKTYSKDYKNETISIFNKYMQYLQKLQQKYDEETEHSRNKRKQKEWESFIRKELEK